jgi:hypothetical protein
MAVTGADAARETSSVRNLSDHLRGRANSSSSRLWSAKIARVRTEVEVGQFSSQRALARTLFSAYSLGLNSEYLSEALIILRDLHGRALDENLAQDTLDLGEALFAEYRRTGQVKHLEDMLAIHARVSTHRLLRTSLDCQHARALIARGVCVQEHGDLQRAKELISTIEPRLTDSSSSEFLVACNIYHGTTWRDHNPHNLEQLRLILDQSTDQLNRHGLVRWRSEVLGCCFLVCNAICSVGGNPDEMECTILTELNDDALQTRAKSVMDPSDMLCSLTLLYLNLGSRHAEAFYIAKAREWVERISHTLTDQSMDPTETLHSLGMCLYVARSWLILGDNVVFEDTITHYRKAIGHSPYPHAIRHQYLLGLSLSLFMLFQYTGSMSALNEGTALSQNYRDIASTSPPLAIVLARLLSERVQAGRLRNASKHGLLQRAIQVLQSALAHTRSGSVHHSPLLQQLSSLYQLQGDLGLSPDRAEHLAIVRIRSSLPFKGDLPEQLQTKLDLIHALLELAREAKDQTALQEATLLLTDINKTSGVIAWHGESIRPDLELLHGSSHIIRGILSGTTVEPATIAEMFVSSNGDISGSTIDHLSRCLKWARLARAAVDHTLEMQAYRHAIGLLPRLAHLGGDISSRLKALHLVEGMATRAAVLALSMDGVCEAIELLEQARGVVWSQSLHPRVSLEAIPQDHVASFTQATESLRMSSDATERRQYAAELEFIIGRIRKVEGYERFLLPCLYQELRACAARGFIVLVIPSDTATHVVVIASPTSSPVHLRLSALKLGRLHSLTANLKSMSDRSRDSEVGEARGMKKVEVPSVKAALRSEYVDVLGELWTELVYPIITSVSLQVRRLRLFDALFSTRGTALVRSTTFMVVSDRTGRRAPNPRGRDL